ncbi:hypothetical protein J6590_076339 [Homalodisca vitripennis]|nr:hypothetical protein J6590_076339 [Homalodisca vitripennis]
MSSTSKTCNIVRHGEWGIQMHQPPGTTFVRCSYSTLSCNIKEISQGPVGVAPSPPIFTSSAGPATRRRGVCLDYGLSVSTDPIHGFVCESAAHNDPLIRHSLRFD